MRAMVERVQSVVERSDGRHAPLYLCGMSLGGTRALKLAVFLDQHAREYWARPRAVAVVDAPLDMLRFWHTEQRVRATAFHPAATDEAQWVSYLLEKNLGGTPRTNPEAYVRYSPYAQMAPRGGNAVHLHGVPIRAYHEPDVDWWIEHRRKTYYEMNSIDLAALVNELKLQGNDRAELVTSHRRRDGWEASPHTWSFVDDAALVDWFLAQAAP